MKQLDLFYDYLEPLLAKEFEENIPIEKLIELDHLINAPLPEVLQTA